jgi:hypothetical protein
MLFVKKNAKNQMQVFKGKGQPSGPATSQQNNYMKNPGANVAPGSGLEHQA